MELETIIIAVIVIIFIFLAIPIFKRSYASCCSTNIEKKPVQHSIQPSLQTKQTGGGPFQQATANIPNQYQHSIRPSLQTGGGPFQQTVINRPVQNQFNIPANAELHYICNQLTAVIRGNGLNLQVTGYLGDGVFGTVFATEDQDRRVSATKVLYTFSDEIMNANVYDRLITRGIWHSNISRADWFMISCSEYTVRSYTNGVPEVTRMYNRNNIRIVVTDPNIQGAIQNSITANNIENKGFATDRLEVVVTELARGKSLEECITFNRNVLNAWNHAINHVPSQQQLRNIFEFYFNLITHCISKNILVIDAHSGNIALRQEPRDINNVPADAWVCYDPGLFKSFDMIPGGATATPAEKYVFTFENVDYHSVSTSLLRIMRTMGCSYDDVQALNEYYTEKGNALYGADAMNRALLKFHGHHGTDTIHIEFCANNVGFYYADFYCLYIRSEEYLREERIRQELRALRAMGQQVPEDPLIKYQPLPVPARYIPFNPNPLLSDFN